MTTGRINQVELDKTTNDPSGSPSFVCVCARRRKRRSAGTQHAAARARACSLARSLLRLALLGFSQDRSAHSRRDRERGRTDAGWLLSSSALLSKGAPHAGVGENKRRRARTTAAAGSHPGASPSSSLSLFSPSSFGRSEEGSEGRQVARVGGGQAHTDGRHRTKGARRYRRRASCPPLLLCPSSLHRMLKGPAHPFPQGNSRARTAGARLALLLPPTPFPGTRSRPAAPPARPRPRARARARERAKATGMGDAGYPPRPVGIGWKRNTRSKREPQRGGPSGPAFTPRKAARGV